MKYINAVEILPKDLLVEIQKYVSGTILYIPSGDKAVPWGAKNGSRQYYTNRNKQIKQQYQDGYGIEQISQIYGLAFDTVRKIIYKK